MNNSAPNNAININNLMSVMQFTQECGVRRDDFYNLRKDGKIDGLVYIAGKTFIDRENVNIRYSFNGYKFKAWVARGRCAAPVAVVSAPSVP